MDTTAGADLRMRGATTVDVDSLPGTIHPFSAGSKSTLTMFKNELQVVMQEKQAKTIAVCIVLNVLCTTVLLLWCSSSNSMALTAYTYLTIFDFFSLGSCLVSVWVKKQQPTPMFSFGYERFEVLSVFGSTILAQLGSLFIMKESVERMVEQPEIHTARLLLGTLLAFVFHMFITYSVRNKAFDHVIAASSSSWLQEHMADISESICHVVPGMSKLLLPRINPFALIAFAGGSALVLAYVLIDISNYHAADTWAAVWVALITVGTLFPMSAYSGKLLLQTTPSHMIGQLDKCIREACTLDGVLEFRHEHFWTLGFANMAGSVHVRVRRDADEQLVLAHVSNRLSNIISILTVQIFKDDWTRTSAYQVLGDTSLINKFPNISPVNSMTKLPSASDGNIALSSQKSNAPTGSAAPYSIYPSPLGAKFSMPSHASSARTNFLLSSPGANTQTPYGRTQAFASPSVTTFAHLDSSSSPNSQGNPAPGLLSMDSLSFTAPSMKIVGADSHANSHAGHSHHHH